VGTGNDNLIKIYLSKYLQAVFFYLFGPDEPGKTFAPQSPLLTTEITPLPVFYSKEKNCFLLENK